MFSQPVNKVRQRHRLSKGQIACGRMLMRDSLAQVGPVFPAIPRLDGLHIWSIVEALDESVFSIEHVVCIANVLSQDNLRDYDAV